MSDQGSKKLISVNCNQIFNLFKPDSGLVIHKQKFDMITLIGRVENISEQSTKCCFMINDGTWPKDLEVLQWKSNDEGDSAMDGVQPINIGNYVRVFGQLRFQNSEIMLVAFKIKPITDFNEIAMHNLQVVYDSMVLRKIKLNLLANKVGNRDRNFNEFKTSDTFSNSAFSGMNEAQKLILDTLKSTTKEEGMSRVELCSSLKSLDPSIISRSLEFLMNEGHVFTTLDNDHFKNAYD